MVLGMKNCPLQNGLLLLIITPWDYIDTMPYLCFFVVVLFLFK